MNLQTKEIEMETLPGRPVRRHVVIYHDRDGARAVPGCVVVAQGDTVVFESLTGESVIFLPEMERMARDPVQGAGIIVLPGGQTADFPISEAAEKGVYPYSVFCTKARRFAIGNSDPTIIIRGREG